MTPDKLPIMNLWFLLAAIVVCIGIVKLTFISDKQKKSMNLKDIGMFLLILAMMVLCGLDHVMR